MEVHELHFLPGETNSFLDGTPFNTGKNYCKKCYEELTSNIPDEKKESTKISIKELPNQQDINNETSLWARPRFNNYKAIFHQTIALPRKFIDLSNSLDFENYRFINQWRIDFPSDIIKSISANEKLVYSIVHKILTRGDYTSASPFLELKLKEKFESEDKFNVRAYEITNENTDSRFWFDGSGYEKKFYEKILPKVLGPNFKRFVIPQVNFHSLVYDYDEGSESKDSQERADFVITTNKSNIVVELDGLEHEEHKSKDYSRTRRLSESNYKEIRIKNSELEDINSKGVMSLIKEVSNLKINDYEKNTNDKYLNSIKLSHQLQISLIELLYNGIINFDNKSLLCIDYSLFKEYSENEKEFIIKNALEDLKLLLTNVGTLYNINNNWDKLQHTSSEKSNVIITYDENKSFENPVCVIQDISFPRIISKELKSSENKIIQSAPKTELLEFFLKYLFNFNNFREGQLNSLQRILQNKDTITLLPTGAGKSLIFQLASFLMPGISITIVPIKSLMLDQVENLEKRGISRAINLSSDIESKKDKKKALLGIQKGEYMMAYVSPERFLIDEFRNVLREFTKKHIVSLVVLDEAHCISEWGHDFRPAYLSVGKNSREYCKNKDGKIPPLIALTGTASENVLIDIKDDLEIKDDSAIISPDTFDRKELHFNIIKCSSDDKYGSVKEIIKEKLPKKFGRKNILKTAGSETNCGIVFCPVTTNKESNPRGVGFFTEKINQDFGSVAKAYSSKEDDRIINARQFQSNKFPLLVATKGYGMGIDKPNIRYIIHVNLPPSIEAFYQEAGRAGRDRKDSECYVIYSNEYEERNKKLMDINNSIEEIRSLSGGIHRWDDFSCLFNFHNSSFKGANFEKEIIQKVVEEIDNFGKEYHPFRSKFDGVNSVYKTYNADELFKVKQKAIFRLTAIGVVFNYGIDYASKEFNLTINKLSKKRIIQKYFEYVKKYNQLRANKEKEQLENKLDLDSKDFIMLCIDFLLKYVYDYYEKGRRQALSTMYNSLEKSISSSNPDKVLREQISNFLKRTYSSQLVDISNIKNIKDMMDLIRELIEGSKDSESLVKPVSDIKSLYGQVARTLEDFPESMGLYLLKAYTGFRINEKTDLILNDLKQFLKLSLETYSFSKEEVYPCVAWIMNKLINHNTNRTLIIFKKLIDEIKDDSLTENLVFYTDNKGFSFEYGKYVLLRNIYKQIEAEVIGG